MKIIKNVEDWFYCQTASKNIQFFDSTQYLVDDFFLMSQKKFMPKVTNSFISCSQKINILEPQHYNFYNVLSNNKIEPQNFEDDEIKVYLTISPQFFHFFMDSLVSILLINKKFPGIKFVINASFLYFDKNGVYNENSTQIVFIKKILKNNNINYSWLMPDHFIKIKNFYNVRYGLVTEIETDEIYNLALSFIKEKNVVPTKKIYLSRKNVNNYKLERLKDEKDLELFFEDNGFEVLAPENLGSFEDQINYFYKTKTIFSVTSSGLTNSIFMQPGNNVIELQTPFETQMNVKGSLELHSEIYSNLCYTKNHNYLAIPSETNSTKTINKIKNNKKMYNFIFGDN